MPVAAALARISESTAFQNVIIGVIVLSGAVIGIETYPAAVREYGTVLHLIDKIILAIFTFEIAIKLGAHGKRPQNFFKDPWNVFDFVIVAICYVPIQAQFVTVLRLARILRVLRLVTVLPRLQLIVGSLLKSVPSIGYVGVLLLLHFYVFAVIGTHLFGANDPFRFGELSTSMLTMFQIVTMENWAELMHTQMYGCDKFGYSDAMAALCTNPTASPIAAALFFVLYIILGTMIILNLFIGVMMKGMEEMQAEVDAARAERNGGADDEIAAIQTELAALTERLKKVQNRSRATA